MTAPDRLAEIRARVTATQQTPKYEDRDGLLSTARAWSDLYQHAPSDLRDLERALSGVLEYLGNAEAYGDEIDAQDVERKIEEALR